MPAGEYLGAEYPCEPRARRWVGGGSIAATEGVEVPQETAARVVYEWLPASTGYRESSWSRVSAVWTVSEQSPESAEWAGWVH